MSWKVVLVIFLIFLFLEIWVGEQVPHYGLLLLNTVIFVILYHLLITLPSVILYNFENKYLKIFIHFLFLIVLFFVVMVFVGIPMYERMQIEEEKYKKMNQSEQQDILIKQTNPYVNQPDSFYISFKLCIFKNSNAAFSPVFSKPTFEK